MHPHTPDSAPSLGPAGAHAAHESTSVDDHAALVRALIEAAVPTGTETLDLGDARDRLTAHDVHSPVDLPLFRNSQMDGFAVRAADLLELPVSLPITGEVAARPGEPAPLGVGEAVRIMTGAAVPDDADAIVPVEDTTTTPGLDGAPDTVTITRGRTVGEYVRERGSDVQRGTVLLPAGTRLAARHLAVLAAAGLATVEVRERLRVVILTTGAELASPGDEVELGQVYDSNAVALDAAAAACGADVTFVIRVTDDDPFQLRGAMLIAKDNADVILTSGGISMGEYEVVRQLLEPLGAVAGHVAMQPGGPQLTGSFDGVPVIGFPGNPVSTQISFEVFVAPVLRELAGLPAAGRPTLAMAASLTSIPGKRQFLRGRRLDGDRVEVVSGPGSHLVAGLAASDVLIDVPTDVLSLNEGDLVETWQL